MTPEFALLSRDAIEQIVVQVVQKTVSELKPERVPPVMTKKQVAAYLDKPISAIDRYMAQGMPYRKEGNDYPEFYKKDIDEWIEKRFQQIEMEVIQ